jgi:hypothetical protein
MLQLMSTVLLVKNKNISCLNIMCYKQKGNKWRDEFSIIPRQYAGLHFLFHTFRLLSVSPHYSLLKYPELLSRLIKSKLLKASRIFVLPQ